MAAKKKGSAKSGDTQNDRQKRKLRERSRTGKQSARNLKSRPSKVTDRDRVLTLASLTRGRGAEKLYTMKEVADALGISTRTLRRIKNQPGYELAPRTYAKIKPDLQREYRSKKRELQKIYNVPKARILPKPVEYRGKAGNSRLLMFASEGLTTEEKVGLSLDMRAPGQFKYWHFKVKVPPGVALSGAAENNDNVNSGDDDAFYMAGPFLFSDEEPETIANHIAEHEDAGREVVEIFMTEMFNK